MTDWATEHRGSMQGGGGAGAWLPRLQPPQVSRPWVACPRCAWACGRLQTDGEPVYSRGHLGTVAQNGRTQGHRQTAGLPQLPELGLSEERPQTGLRDTGVVHNFSPSGSLRQLRDREGLEATPGTAEEAGLVGLVGEAGPSCANGTVLPCGCADGHTWSIATNNVAQN